MDLELLIHRYLAGSELLKSVVSRAGENQLDLHPVPERWSIRQVVCHLADFEIVYADRIKRVLAEDNPTLFGGDPEQFAAALAYDKRCVANELLLISSIRHQIASILQQADLEDYQRTGVHSEAGPLTLETLLERVTDHIPHHVRFIEEKLAAMSAAP